MEYLDTDIALIEIWEDRWQCLSHLIFEIVRTGKPTEDDRVPTPVEENLYQKLRSWFIENEINFLPLWKEYYQSLDWALDIEGDIFSQMRDAEKHLENPFLAAYWAHNLEELLHYISRSSERYPTEKEAWDFAMILLMLNRIAYSFVNDYLDNDF